jgi:hypothetical protein
VDKVEEYFRACEGLAERMDKTLQDYFRAWCAAQARLARLAQLEPGPAVDAAYNDARAEEEYHRMLFFRLREEGKP